MIPASGNDLSQGASYSLGSPGYTVTSALRHASEQQIVEAIGQNAVELLKALDPAFTDIGKLRQAASNLIGPSDLLSNATVRRAIICALPREKAEELARRAKIDSSGDPFASLLDDKAGLASSSSKQAAMLDFFGDDPSDSGKGSAADHSIVEPSYGLFEHQHRAAVEIGKALALPPFKTLMHMPTGSGKTRTGMHVVARHMNARERPIVCWLAQSQELLEQAAEEFEKCWECLGCQNARVVRFWGANDLPGQFEDTTFIVAGFAKLTSLLTRDPNAVLRLADHNTMTVVDEAHQAIAPTYRDAIETLTEKRYGTPLLGLSATPGRTWADIAADAELSAFFGERKVTLKVEGYTDPVSYLIDQGYLAKPVFRTLNGSPGLDLSEGDLAALQSGLDLPDAVLDGLANDQQRNLKILAEIEELTQRHSRVIVFATTVAHARLLTAVLRARGIRSYAVDSGTSPEAREAAIRHFRGADERPMVMCNFGVLTTGFDAPRTSAALIARPTRSLVLYSQMVGRATRGPRAKGNASAEIITVVDPALHGFGDMAQAFTNWEDVWNEHA